MAKTTNVFARVEPNLKEDAEQILTELGIPMSNAIGMYLRQIVLHRGLPFDVKLPAIEPPVALGTLDRGAVDAQLQKGYDAYLQNNGRVAEDVFGDFEQEFGL